MYEYSTCQKFLFYLFIQIFYLVARWKRATAIMIINMIIFNHTKAV